MNSTAVDNPTSVNAVNEVPRRLPGNPHEEAKNIYNQLLLLRQNFPGYYNNVSVTGYSYGAILSVGVVAAQGEHLAAHPGDTPIINGSVAAVSPPENLWDSMNALDSVHAQAQKEHASGLMSVVEALHLKKYVDKHDYHSIDGSKMPASKDGSEERHLVDHFGFREGFEGMLEATDKAEKIYSLPYDSAVHSDEALSNEDRTDLMRQQASVVSATTYQNYVDQTLSRDPWYKQNHTSPAESISGYRYGDLLKSAGKQGIPVLTLLSQDDFILNSKELTAFEKIAQHQAPNEATGILPRGGHVGIYYSPEVREELGNFLSHPPTLKSTAPGK